MTEIDPRRGLALKMAESARKQKEADPHGFHRMSVRELIDWMGAGNALPGSQVYNHAELVLQNKEREAEREHQSSERIMRYMDSFMDELSSPDPDNDLPAGRFTEAQVAIIAVVGAVSAAPLIVVGSVIGTVAVTAVTLMVLFVKPVRHRAVQLLHSITR